MTFHWKQLLLGILASLHGISAAMAAPPVITTQPADQTAILGGTAVFSVVAEGTDPLAYRWFFNNAPLSNGGGVSGATATTLFLSNVEAWMAGSYRVMITNTDGNVTSASALLTVPGAVSLAEALDTTATPLIWTQVGSPPWFGQSSLAHDGVDAAQSGPVLDSGSSSVQTTITGPGIVSFHWKVSSETNSDRMRFYINGTEQASISGEVNWQQRTYTLAAGSQTVRWSYTKNASGQSGQDRAWLDEVQFIPGDCTVTLSPGARSHGPPAATATILVAVPSGCSWGVVNTNAWITTVPVIGATNYVQYSITANPGPESRSGVIQVGGQPFTVTQLGGACTYTLSASSRIHGAGAENASVGVTTMPGCPWVVVNPAAWIQITSGASGSESGIVTYSVDANPASLDRSATVTIAGSTFTVTQLGGNPGCTFALSPTSATHDAGLSTNFVNLATAAGCAWNTVNTNAWITVINGTGSDSAQVGYIVAANLSSTPRTGTLRIGGLTFTVTQSGGISLAEAIDVVSAPVTLSTIGTPAWIGQSLTTHDGSDAAEISGVADGSAATLQAVVTGPGTLSFWWRASSELTNDYLKYFINGVQQTRISGDTAWEFVSFELGAGAQTSKWTYAKNASGTAGLDRGWVDQVVYTPAAVSCATISPASRSHPSVVSTGLVTVVAAANCSWTAVNTNPWVAITVGASGAGNGVVIYRLVENPAPASRTGTIVIEGQMFTITQSGTACSFTLAPTSASFEQGGGSGTASLFTVSGCAWTIFNTNGWITLFSPTNNLGNGTVAFSVAANPNAGARSGTLLIAGQPFVVNQAGTVPVASGPRLVLEQVQPPAGAALTVQGRAGKLHVIEASGDLVHWTPISTNLMPASVCPTCPFLQLNDNQALISPLRFYRAVELP